MRRARSDGKLLARKIYVWNAAQISTGEVASSSGNRHCAVWSHWIGTSLVKDVEEIDMSLCLQSRCKQVKNGLLEEEGRDRNPLCFAGIDFGERRG